MNLTSKIIKGDVRAAARLMRGVEDGDPNAIEELSHIYHHTGKAHIIGVTGTSGAGKSTLVDTIISILRQKNMTVGVIATDPTSPFTGGAILGDRIRMQQHTTDRGVFIRSLATRGWTGGLSKAAISMIHIMDAMSKDIILVETTGIGQVEIDVTRIADTCILILTPGMGDAIQIMKAGILEAADIFVINKADQDGANTLEVELCSMIGMKKYHTNDWEPVIILTEAINNKGIDELVEEIFNHRQFLLSCGGLEKRRGERARLELNEAVTSAIKNFIEAEIEKDYLKKITDDLVQRKTDPGSAALEIINRSIKPTKSVRAY
jgi:LAO/AO transport system kinase